MGFNFRLEHQQRYLQIAKGRAGAALPDSATLWHVAPGTAKRSDKGGAAGFSAFLNPGYDAILEKLRQAPDLEAVLGLALLQPKYVKAIQIFLLSARGYDAGAASYDEIAALLRDPRSLVLADPLVQQILQITPNIPCSKAAISRAFKDLEAYIPIPLVHSGGEGLAYDGLTDAGKFLVKLIEAYLFKCCNGEALRGDRLAPPRPRG